MPLILALSLLALMAGAAAAKVVAPIIYEQKDMGTAGLSTFTYALSVDCTAATISLVVMDGNLTPVEGAYTYLNYEDFSSQLISNVQTNPEGQALLKLPGSVKLMQGIFTLVIEKYGYMNKEIHFDISPCYSNSTIQKPPKPVQPNQTGGAKPQPNSTANSSQIIPPTHPANLSTNQTAANKTGPQNGTGSQGQQGGLCPSAVLLSFLALAGGAYVMASRKPKSGKKPWGRYAPGPAR